MPYDETNKDSQGGDAAYNRSAVAAAHSHVGRQGLLSAFFPSEGRGQWGILAKHDGGHPQTDRAMECRMEKRRARENDFFDRFDRENGMDREHPAPLDPK